MERNRYICHLHYFKKQSISKRVLDCKKDTKELFCLVNKLTGNTTQNSLPPNKTEEQLAEDFAKFILSKIEEILETFNQHTSIQCCTQHDTPKFASFHPLTEMEVCTVRMNMKNKHCELDIIPISTLKQILDVYLPKITQIVNLSLTMGEFCEEWKTPIVKPLLKKPGLDLINKNYRPISNLPFISKLVEKCMLKQLLGNCENHDLLPDFHNQPIAWTLQYRDKPHQAHQWHTVVNGKTAVDSNCNSGLISSLWHSGPWNPTTNSEQNFGSCGKALHWFQNYLRPWSFRVNINGKYSKLMDLKFSVPQGSCSGANLCTCYCSLIKIPYHHW